MLATAGDVSPAILFFGKFHAMTTKASSPAQQTRPITKALAQNDAVKGAVEQSANELLVVNAVLQKKHSGQRAKRRPGGGLAKKRNHW